jgi:hypothetical protein
MLLSQTIDTIDQEINQLMAQIEAKKQRQSQLIELDALTDDVLEQLGNVVSKIKHHAPEATTCLRETVLNLLNDGDSDSGGGNQPTSPEPDTNPTLETDNSGTQETEQPNHHSSEQPADSYSEIVGHPDNLALAYQKSCDRKTICIYIGCNNHSRLKSWSEWIYRQDWGLTRQETYAIHPAVHLNFKYELKLPPLPSFVLDSLARHNYSKPPILPPEKLPLLHKAEFPFKLGSRITRLSAPDEVFIVKSETLVNSTFFAESEKTGEQELVNVDDAVLYSEQSEAKVLCEMSSTNPRKWLQQSHP